MQLKLRKKAKIVQQNTLTPKQQKQAAPDYEGFDVLTEHQIELRKRLPPMSIIVLIMGAIMLFAGLADDGFVPALNEMSVYFGVKINSIQVLVPIFFIGLGIGQFIWGPYVDRFGRRSLVIVCSILGILSNFWAISSHTYENILVARFVQGIIYSGLATAPQIVIKDVSSPRDFIILNSWVIMIFLLAPATSPMIGGWVLLLADWKWIFHVISLTVGLSLVIFMIFIPETIDPIRKQPLNTKRILSNYKDILTHHKSVMIIIITCLYGLMLWSFPTLLPAVLMEDYGISPQNVGYFIFVTVFIVMIGIYTNQYIIKQGASPSKVWLYAAIVQGFTLIINFVVAWNIFGVSLNPYTIIIAIACNVFFNNFQLANMQGIYLMDYPHMTGTATSLITALRLLIPGVVVSLFALIPRYQGRTVLMLNLIILATCLILTIYFHAKYKIKRTPVTLASELQHTEIGQDAELKD